MTISYAVERDGVGRTDHGWMCSAIIIDESTVYTTDDTQASSSEPGHSSLMYCQLNGSARISRRSGRGSRRHARSRTPNLRRQRAIPSHVAT